MKKFLTILSVVTLLLVVASGTFAETDYKAMKEITKIKQGKSDLENPKASGTLSVDTISEYTAANGVTVDSVLLKDGDVDADLVTVDAAQGIDTKTAGILKIGESTATSVEIGDAGVATDVQGDLTVQLNIDTKAAGILNIGPSTATGVTIADASIPTIVEGPLSSGQNVTFDSTNAVWRQFSISDDYGLVATPTAQGAVTNGQAIQPLGLYFTVAPAGAVTCTVANAGAVGQVFNIISLTAGPITFADSGNLKLSGDAVLGQYDTLSLYFTATNIAVETSQVDN